jgi:hypothetical protein
LLSLTPKAAREVKSSIAHESRDGTVPTIPLNDVLLLSSKLKPSVEQAAIAGAQRALRQDVPTPPTSIEPSGAADASLSSCLLLSSLISACSNLMDICNAKHAGNILVWRTPIAVATGHHTFTKQLSVCVPN